MLVSQPVKKILAFNGAERVIILYTREPYVSAVNIHSIHIGYTHNLLSLFIKHKRRPMGQLAVCVSLLTSRDRSQKRRSLLGKG
jgi:hypothetical protein